VVVLLEIFLLSLFSLLLSSCNRIVLFLLMDNNDNDCCCRDILLDDSWNAYNALLQEEEIHKDIHKIAGHILSFENVILLRF